MAGSRDTINFQEAILTRMAEERAAKGGIQPIEIKLRKKYLIDEQYKFGGKKKKAGNSGGTGKAGRRKKRPSVPSGIR